MIYLGTSRTPQIEAAIRNGVMGRLCTPAGGCLPVEGAWAADSGAFTRKLDPVRYFEWLRRMAPYQDRCLFAPAADVVGDWKATVEVALPMVEPIRLLGYPAAVVLQDGASVDTVPWDDFDVAFIGGTTEWKLGPDVVELCQEAADRRVPVHVGRVNSGRRFRYARDALGARSADGTFLSFAPTENYGRFLKWLT